MTDRVIALADNLTAWDDEYQSLATDHSEYVGRLNAISERIEALRATKIAERLGK